MVKQSVVFAFFIAILLGSFIASENLFSSSFQYCAENHQQTNKNAATEKNNTGVSIAVFTYFVCTGRFVEAHNGAITALATLVIAAFTGTLWIATSKQAEITKEAFVADRRAFVGAVTHFAFWERMQNTEHYGWRFSPIWVNSGETHTRNLRIYTDWELVDSFLPTGFDFSKHRSEIGVGGLITPKAQKTGGTAPHAGYFYFTGGYS